MKKLFSFLLLFASLNANAYLSTPSSGGGTGILTLNTLTADPQLFATGTSGTNFSISSAGDTHTFNLPTASGTNTGKLSSSDWTLFNAKEPAITAGTTSQYLRGDKSLSTFSTDVQSSVSAVAPITATAGVFSMAASTNSVDGYLTAADHTTFNAKEGAITATTSADFYRGDKTMQPINTAVRAAVSAAAPLTFTSGTGVFSMSAATSSADGYLSSAVYTLFNTFFDFGAATDGTVTINDGLTTTLTRSMYYNDLTVTANSFLDTGGYLVFVKGKLTIASGSGVGRAAGNGTAGSTGAAGGAGGAAGTPPGGTNTGAGGTSQAGGASSATTGAQPTATSAFNTTFGGAGGTGGAGGAGASGAGGGGRPAGAFNSPYFIRNLTTVFTRGTTLVGGGGAGGAGGGAGGDGTTGGGGGGGGAGGGGAAIFAHEIDATGASAFSCLGGNGGNGGDGSGSNRGGGGGGGAGGGGYVYIVYSTSSGGGFSSSNINVAGGTGGTGGAKTGTGVAGNNGANGSTGNYAIFNVTTRAWE